MALSVKVAGTWRDSAPYVKVAGAWRQVVRVQVKVAGVWRDVLASASASASPGSASASDVGNGPFSTGWVSVSVSGGVGPFTYLWERVSGDVAISPHDANVSSVYFIASGTAPETKTAVWRCKVTDTGMGTTTYTGNVSVSIEFQASPPPFSASTDPDSVYGFHDISLGAGTATTDSTTCTPINGSGSYSYLWEYVSGSVSIGCNNATAATTTFSSYFTTSGLRTAVWRCKVTDNNTSEIVYTEEVTVDCEASL